MNWILEPWTFPFMRWALLACLILAGIHAYLGFHVVRRGVLFVDLALAQMAALGAALGVAIGLEHGTLAEYALSAGAALATAFGLAVVRSRRIPLEAIVAIVYGLATAATFVVLEHSPHGLEEVKHLLVGQVLTVAPDKILGTGALYAALGLLLARFHRSISAATEATSAVHRTAEIVFYGVFALVVTSSVGVVGVLLVFAFLVIPAVGGILLGRSERGALAWGWAIAAAGSLLGLVVAFQLDYPAAPVIVLSLGGLLLAAALLRRRREDRERAIPGRATPER